MSKNTGKAVEAAQRGAITRKSNKAAIHGAVIKGKDGKALAYGLSSGEPGSKEHGAVCAGAGKVMATVAGITDKQLRNDLAALARATGRANGGIIGYGDFSIAIG